MRRRRMRGMTLIEIMVVVVILGLIATAVGVAVIGHLETAREERVVLDGRAFKTALDAHRMRTGKYPPPPDGLRQLVEEGVLDSAGPDPWGNAYVYLVEDGRPVVLSYGADGQPGGTGTDRDLEALGKGPRSRGDAAQAERRRGAP